VAALLAAARAQPPGDLGFQVDTNVCGFNVGSSRIQTCAEKELCDGSCQRAICEALVQFGEVAAGSEQDPGIPGWPRNASKCAAMREYGYCSWEGVACCCLQARKNAAAAAAPCDRCQIVNGSRVGSVASLQLKDFNLNGSLADLLGAIEPLGELGLFEISLQVRARDGSGAPA
jgi:hypothetical protein